MSNANLNKSRIKPVALSLIEPYPSQFVSQSRSIPTIPDLFDDENLKLSYTDLLKKCFSVEKCQVKKFCKLRETHSSCCGLGCGEVKCPLCIDRCDFDSYVLKKNSCLEKVAGKFQLKRSHNYFFFKSNNSFLHYQKESTMTLLFAPLTVSIVLQL